MPRSLWSTKRARSKLVCRQVVERLEDRLLLSVSAFLSSGTLNVNLNAAGDTANLSVNASNQIVVADGVGNTIFTTPQSGVTALNVTGTNTGTQTLNFNSTWTLSGLVEASQISDVSINAALTANEVQLFATNNVAINASVTTDGLTNLDADYDGNSAGQLSVAAGATVNTTGQNITCTAATLAIAGTINCGSGLLEFDLSPTFSVSGSLLSHIICSNRVTIYRPAGAGAVTFSDTSGASLTGTVDLQFVAGTSFSTSGINLSAGNASLAISVLSSSNTGFIVLNGAVQTGTGSINFQTPGTVNINAAMTGGPITFGGGAGVTIASGITVNSGGHNVQIQTGPTTGTGTINAGAGNVTYSFSNLPSGTVTEFPDTITSGTLTFEAPIPGPTFNFNAPLDAGITGPVVFNQVGTLGPVYTALSNQPVTIVDTGSLAINGVIDTGTAPLTITAANATIGSALEGGSITIGALGNITIDSPITTQGPITIGPPVRTDSPAATITTESNAQLNSNGHDINFDAAALTIGSTVNSGSGNIDYAGSFPIFSLPGAFASIANLQQALMFDTTSSGTVSAAGPAQTAGPSETFGLTVGPGVTGILSLSLPGSVTLTSMSTAEGNATLGLSGEALVIDGPLNTGAGSLTLGGISLTINGTTTTGGTFTANGSGGFLTIGAQISAGGAVTINNTSNVGPVTINAPVATTSGTLAINSAGQLTVNSVVSAPGLVTLSTSAPVQIDAAASISSATSGVEVSASSITDGAAISAPSGFISLSPHASSTIQAGATLNCPTLMLNVVGTLAVDADLGNTNVTVANGGQFLNPAANLALNVTQHLASLTTTGGIAVSLPAGAVETLFTGALTMRTALGDRLDLADNSLQLTYAAGNDPIATIRQYISSAYAAGAWTGPGLTTSLADANHGLGYADSADGVDTSLPPNTILVRRARYGDANLDGSVNFADLVSVAQHYGQTSMNWDQGDFNYDGSVNFADLVALAQNYGATETAAVAANASLDPATATAQPHHRRRLFRHGSATRTSKRLKAQRNSHF